MEAQNVEYTKFKILKLLSGEHLHLQRERGMEHSGTVAKERTIAGGGTEARGDSAAARGGVEHGGAAARERMAVGEARRWSALGSVGKRRVTVVLTRGVVVQQHG